MGVSEEVDISCQYQGETDSGLTCGLAESNPESETHDTNADVCTKCEIGRVYREAGCPSIGGSKRIIDIRPIGGRFIQNGRTSLYCKKTKRETSLEDCMSCSLVSAETTKQSVEKASGLYESMGFTNALGHLNAAHKKINIDQDYDGAIREATVSLESVLKGILQLLNADLPKSLSVTKLYEAVKQQLTFGDDSRTQYLKQVLSGIDSSITGLGAMRNDLSDAHGKGLVTPELYESYAELALNLSATMSTFVIRRYKEAYAKKES